MKIQKMLSALVASTACLSLQAFAEPLVQNGSFETWSGGLYQNPFPGLAAFASIDGWTSSSGRTDIFFTPGYNGYSGPHALRLHPDGSVATSDNVYQTIAGFSIGSNYELSFSAAASAVYAYGSWANISNRPGARVGIGQTTWETPTIRAFDSNTAVFGANPFFYTRYTVPFVATAESMVLRFEVLNPSEAGGVAIDLVEISPVPEPGQAAMLLLGLLALSWWLTKAREKSSSSAQSSAPSQETPRK